jgi:hypothetical protein
MFFCLFVVASTRKNITAQSSAYLANLMKLILVVSLGLQGKRLAEIFLLCNYRYSSSQYWEYKQDQVFWILSGFKEISRAIWNTSPPHPREWRMWRSVLFLKPQKYPFLLPLGEEVSKGLGYRYRFGGYPSRWSWSLLSTLPAQPRDFPQLLK